MNQLRFYHLLKRTPSLKGALFLLVIFCGISFSGFGQAEMQVQDTVRNVPPPKPKYPLRVTGVRFGLDPAKHIIAGISRFYRSVTDYGEFYLDFTLNNRFFISGAYGFSATGRSDISEDKSYFYNNKGNYYRLGVDYNILGGKTQYDAVYFGLRYFNSTFDHEIQGTTTKQYWDDPALENNRSQFDYTENGLKASWIGIAVGFKVRIIGELYGGIEGRIDNGLQVDESPNFSIVDIPGYGLVKSGQTSKYNFSYSLIYRIPLWKHPAYEDAY